MKSVLLPPTETVRHMLATLLGRQVTVKKGNAVDLGGKNAVVVGLYVADSGDVAALCLSSLAFAGFAGAALSLIPPAGVQDEVRAGTLGETVVDNFREVLNVLSGAINKPDAPHVVLRDTCVCPPATLPEEARALVTNPLSRIDLEISVAGYGDGQLSILAAL